MKNGLIADSQIAKQTQQVKILNDQNRSARIPSFDTVPLLGFGIVFNQTSRTICRYLKLDLEPFPKKIQAGRDLVKNGENLPKIVTEDVRNVSPSECIKMARFSKGNRGKIIDLIRGTPER